MGVSLLVQRQLGNVHASSKRLFFLCTCLLQACARRNAGTPAWPRVVWLVVFVGLRFFLIVASNRSDDFFATARRRTI